MDASGAAITRATATDGLGGFVFGDLLTGTYRISETQPAGYLDGLESVGNLGGLVGGAAPDYDEIGSIPYIPGQFGDGYIFNEVAPARVTGYVFYDVNGSGDRDGGDLNLADGTVHELDVIILATGFDAGTGALTRIDIPGPCPVAGRADESYRTWSWLRATHVRLINAAVSSRAGWRSSLAVGYQGLSSRPASQRQSAEKGSQIQTGLPMAPARWATEVSTEITRSNCAMAAAVSAKSANSAPSSSICVKVFNTSTSTSRTSFCRP